MKRMVTFLLGIGILILALVLGYFLGPKPAYPSFDGKISPIGLSIHELESHIAEAESNVQHLKPNNKSRIVWADSVRKTPYAIVYLHGFSASPMEGHPTHVEFAKRYGCNLYIPRLAGHGIEDDDSFLTLTPKDLIESAKKAIAIGKKIGDKVLLMSCSTGSTLSIYLASQNPDDVEAMILYSPNIALADANAKLLTGPWGTQLARAIVGEYREIKEIKDKEAGKYWTYTYRTEGLVGLQALIDQTMKPEVFQKIYIPYFLGYYYKNEQEHDQVVSVKAMEAFAQQTSTPEPQKRLVKFPNAGNHVITSDLYSKDLVSVQAESYRFAEEVLGLTPVKHIDQSTL